LELSVEGQKMQSAVVLNFNSVSPDRSKPFTKEAELASVLALIEARRSKGGLIRRKIEKTDFTAKMYYPVWGIPWEGKSFIFDGTGYISQTIIYEKLPDLDSFLSDIKRSSANRENYEMTLLRHNQTFKSFKEEEKIEIKSLIADKPLTDDIVSLARQGTPATEADQYLVIPIKLSKEDVVKEVNKLIEVMRKIKNDIDGLIHVMEVLEEESNIHQKKIEQEISRIKEKYDSEIDRIRPYVEKQIEELEGEREKKLKGIVADSSQRQSALAKQKSTLETEYGKLKKIEEQYKEKEITSRIQKDKKGEDRLKSELKRLRNDISEVERKISLIEKEMTEIRASVDAKTREIENTFQSAIEQEKARIKQLENGRDSEINIKSTEIEKIKSNTFTIINQINDLLNRKRLQKSGLENLATLWNPEDISLIYIPFYLARFEGERKARYIIIPPVTAQSHSGILRSIKDAISSLESRLTSLLKPTSKPLRDYLASIIEKNIEKNPILEKSLYELGEKSNILKTINFREDFKKGLDELVAEGWINQEERNNIMNSYTIM
jgi:hypothetical protein